MWLARLSSCQALVLRLPVFCFQLAFLGHIVKYLAVAKTTLRLQYLENIAHPCFFIAELLQYGRRNIEISLALCAFPRGISGTEVVIKRFKEFVPFQATHDVRHDRSDKFFVRHFLIRRIRGVIVIHGRENTIGSRTQQLNTGSHYAKAYA